MLAAMAASYPDAVVVCRGRRVRALRQPRGRAAARRHGRRPAGQAREPARPPRTSRLRSRGLAARIVAGEHVATPSVMEMQREDGSTFFAEVTLSPLVGDDGAVVGLIAVGRDVTARIAAEADAARLRGDRRRRQRSDPRASTPTARCCSSARPRSACSAGPRTRSSGAPATSSWRRSTGSARRGCSPSSRANGSFRRPTVALRRDGTHVEVELSAAEIIGKHGSVIGAALTVLDVSERKRTRRLLDRIIEHAPNAIAVKDLDGRYLGVQLAVRRWRAAELRRPHGRRPAAGGHGAAQRSSRTARCSRAASR